MLLALVVPLGIVTNNKMKKIFCIICHKLSNPLLLTVRYLSSFDENIVIIHVDRKSNMDDFLILRGDRVLFTKIREKVEWGGAGQMLATIALLKEALAFDFEYMFLISGDDLPCASNVDIDIAIKNIEFKNLVDYQDQRSHFVDPIERVKYSYPSFFFSKDKKILNKIKCRLFNLFRFFFINRQFKEIKEKNITFYKGTQWFSLNKQTVSELIAFIDSNDWYVSLFSKSFCGDEIFFHTALKLIGRTDFYHDPLKINDALRYIDWNSGPDYPRSLNNEDLHKIKSSSCIFARKFSDEVDETFFQYLISGDASNHLK